MSWNEHGGGRGKYVHITETPDVRHITNPDVMHEESDVSVRGVGAFVAALAAGMVLIMVLMSGLYKLYEWRAEVADRSIPVTPMARKPDAPLPPPPRLQAAPGFQSLDPHDPNDPRFNFALKAPSAEWDALHQKWDYELNNPAATDASGQTMRVPIDAAKQMLLQKGLPVRQSQQGGAGVIIPQVPTYSSAGRQTESREEWVTNGRQ